MAAKDLNNLIEQIIKSIKILFKLYEKTCSQGYFNQKAPYGWAIG